MAAKSTSLCYSNSSISSRIQLNPRAVRWAYPTVRMQSRVPRLIEEQGTVLIPRLYDGLSEAIVQQIGFSAMLISDCLRWQQQRDTGGGYALNVQRTAKDLIAAGAAGCFLEVLAVPMLTPHSYTREDVIELQCHGSKVCLCTLLFSLSVVAHDNIYIFLVLDDLIKLSKSDTKGNKRKKSRRAKVERTSYSAARDNNTSKEKHYVNSLSGVSQGAVAKRGSNFKGNQFPVTTREAATVPPLRVPRRGFNPGGTNSENQSRSRCWIIL
ncbi:unnamed protein product [Eruca vesicaria subsp. sativa]|uniref:GTP-binding protein TrmE N-terminal domain-containing protein n=1 Tax=Eruca vesicaria subsp. sativa TaxID=29727 RepID=A0ABC8L7X6_ERUVS|nr:unnamed protein product [Eruca vesicaria subsp. sativa]